MAAGTLLGRQGPNDTRNNCHEDNNWRTSRRHVLEAGGDGRLHLSIVVADDLSAAARGGRRLRLFAPLPQLPPTLERRQMGST